MYIIIVGYVAIQATMTIITKVVMVHYHDLAVADSEMMIPKLMSTSNPGNDLHETLKGIAYLNLS